MRSDDECSAGEGLSLDHIRIRDPFVFVDSNTSRYWLYGTTDADPWGGRGVGFDAWWSTDLERWYGPTAVFRPPSAFWATDSFWAPEVYAHHDRIVMFATFRSDTAGRGVQTLIASGPEGPFELLSAAAVTPSGWECLDGTLFQADDGTPWMVFCHEWLQVGDGRMCAMPLSRALDSAAGDPIELFRASSAPWVRPVQERHHFVTDGPFMYRSSRGSLLLIWSSFSRRGYAIGVARSSSGLVKGPWKHRRRPLGPPDGGHAMLFRDFELRLRMAYHAPNRSPLERARLVEVADTGHRLSLRRPRRWHRWLKGLVAGHRGL